MTKEKHFINLTNGIEFIQEIMDKGHDINFVRVQSTTIERKNWVKLIGDLDHNLLMYLALGYDCYFYDCGTNRPLSKTCYLGIPLIQYILHRRWTGEVTPAIRHSRDGRKTFNEEGLFDFIYNSIFLYNQDASKEGLKKKIDYYKKYITGDVGKIIPVSMSTIYDGKYSYYSNIVNKLL